MGRSRVATTALLCAVGLTLAGCGSETSDSDPGGGPTGASGMTAPGTSLAVGETATVPVDDFAKVAPAQDGVLELTVASIEKGDPADLPSLDGTPYYVHLEAKAVSGDVYGFFVEKFVGAWAGGERVAPIATPLRVGSCERTHFAQHAAAGTTLDTCLTFVVTKGDASVDRIGFADDRDYSFDDDTAITWN